MDLVESKSPSSSFIESKSEIPPPAVSTAGPKDGGYFAWLQCAGSFCLFLNSWGLVNSFGVYQTYYEQTLFLNESASTISWIGSTQAFLLVIGGIFVGPLYDRGNLKNLLCIGGFLVVFGMMITSLCSLYWHALLAQGVVVGSGCGFLFVPSVAILPPYFSKNRALALGVAAAGSSLGGVVYPIIFRVLQPRIGFGWATRVLGFIVLITLSFAVLVLRMRVKPAAVRRLFDFTVWKEVPFSIFGFCTFFGFIGLYIPFFYIQIYSIEKNIVSEDLTFYLLPIMNAGSFFGRILPNIVADRIGPINALIPSTVVAAVLAFVWIRVESLAGILVFCLLYGFFSGALVSLFPIGTVALSPSMNVVGTRLGMISLFLSTGLLIGTPVAGVVLRKYGWLSLQAFCGATLLLSAICSTAVRVARVGYRFRARS